MVVITFVNHYWLNLSLLFWFIDFFKSVMKGLIVDVIIEAKLFNRQIAVSLLLKYLSPVMTFLFLIHNISFEKDTMTKLGFY